MLWPTLEETVVTLRGAGGIAVLAHPLDYKMTATRLRALTRAFADAGGEAIEVINGRPRPGDTDTLWRLVKEHDLMRLGGLRFSSRHDVRLRDWASTSPTSQQGCGVWERL